MIGKSELVVPAVPMNVCQVCREVRPDDEIALVCRDVSERFGLEEHLFFFVKHCRDRRVCREQAEARAESFARGELVTVEWNLPLAVQGAHA